MKKSRKKSGFTLTELSFAVLFVALLALTVIVITMNLIASYRRGLMLKQVNTVGNDLIDDLRASISSSSSNTLANLCELKFSTPAAARTACEQDGAYSATYLVRLGNVTVGKNTRDEKTIQNAPLYGAFCSGSYSYIWNSGYYFSDNYEVTIPSATLHYKLDGESNVKNISDFRLIKIKDPNRVVCISKITANGYTKNTDLFGSLNGNFNLTSSSDAFKEDAIDMLENDTYSDLAFYDLSVFRPAVDTTKRNVFYNGSFILATIAGGINITASGDYCATPEEYDIEDFDYCAINKFNFAIQASGE
ncbi:hypothetical protein IKH83_04005 [Candidatus Saccharibacteria bacterium]|nr:hypothetical protein [Candidatus Saccharibacteria bacterium]